MQELARSLSPAMAAQASAAVRARVELIASAGLPEAAQEAITANLAPLLDALAITAPTAPRP